MDTKHETDMTIPEQGSYLVTLAHDEFLESVIDGEQDDYIEWAEFIHECLDKIVGVPQQR